MTDRPKTADLANRLTDRLRHAGTADRALNEKRYLKSPIEHFGTRMPEIRKAVKRLLRECGSLGHRRLLALVRRLWKGRYHEQRMAAVLLLEANPDLLEPDDLPLVEEMIRGSFTWAYVDVLAGKVAGGLVEAHPELVEKLDAWSADESFWVRRASMLALMGPLRRGEGDWERFVRYAEPMLDETEFFIRKAIGWVLRETSKKRPGLVREYVEAKLPRLSGVTFREAVKRLPTRDKKALEKAREALR